MKIVQESCLKVDVFYELVFSLSKAFAIVLSVKWKKNTIHPSIKEMRLRVVVGNVYIVC